jgi:hypothetical protein
MLGGYLFTLLDEKAWEDFKGKYTREEGIEILADRILDEGHPLPMVQVSMEDAIEDFEELKGMDCRGIIEEGEFFSRYEYAYGFTDTIIRCSNVGNKSSNVFHQDARWACNSINSPSPLRTWTTRKFLVTLLKALYTLKVKRVDSTTLRSCIALRKYIASQFRPSAAKAVYQHFNAKNVLDMSCGWGDRLTGFMATQGTESYTGVDPNPAVFYNYQKQIEAFGGSKHYDIEMIGSEVVEYKRKFDLVFTSPPYFNIEKYCQEESQSFRKFRKVEDWLEGFLFESLRRAVGSLETGGHLVINISDVYSNHRINQLCNPMNDFLQGINGMEYQGAMAYEMRKRPNSGALKGKVGRFAEPMWVWKKVK